MNTSQLFTGRAFLSEKKESLFYTHKYSSIINEIIKKSNLNFKCHRIEELYSNENFDSYLLEDSDYLFNSKLSQDGDKPVSRKIKIKLSLDENCEDLIRESDFLNQNESLFTEKIISHGVLEGKFKVRYLLVSYEIADSLKDLGRYIIFDNLVSFIFTFLAFSGLKCKTSFKKHYNSFFKDRSPYKFSKFIKESIEVNYGLKDVKSVFSSLKDFCQKNYEEDVFKGNSVCHGSLSKEDIIFRDGCFKFINCNKTFKSNKLFDVAFFVLNSGFKQNDVDFILYHYSLATKIDIAIVEKDFEKCMKVAVCMFYTDIMHSYIIETCVFLSKRESTVLDLIESFSKSFYWLEKFDIIPEYRDIISDILSEPIISNQVDVSSPPNDIVVPDRLTEEKKANKPKVNASLNKNENGDLYIDISWSYIDEFSKYFCYVLKPNGKTKQYKNSECINIKYKDIDVLGSYGIGVKTIGGEKTADSDFDVVTLDVLNI